MSRHTEETVGGDAVIVTMPAQGRGSRADWLQGLETDGATEVDAGAAEIVRDLRERCEGVDPRRR